MHRSDEAFNLIDKLEQEENLSKDEFIFLLEHRSPALSDYAAERAVSVRKRLYGTGVYLRGLIEFSSFCKNDCYYCGIRAGNRCASRYRLSDEDILDCCENGYLLGFRTFVLQSGEDPGFSDERLCALVREIKRRYPDCAVTLSVGEREHETYLNFFESGADRYLLRHETASPEHYRLLHPESLSCEHRKKCLYDLKSIGFQTGAGFMVGSPYQTKTHLAEDMCFLKELRPHMVGIGPFIPQHDTPFAGFPAGTAEETCFLLSLIRLMLPGVLLPATTALGTIHPLGREKGILAGANVIMPNLSPAGVRDKYLLYDGKICTDEEAAECRGCISARMKSIGYDCVVGRGDSKI